MPATKIQAKLPVGAKRAIVRIIPTAKRESADSAATFEQVTPDL